MEGNADSQGEGSFQEHNYYESMDDVLQDESEYQPGDVEQRSPLREQDRFLPIANISKIMKRSVPANGKIAKDAKECVQECVSEFISFITSEAAERCQNEKRKTINGEDILCAMNHLGFDNYVEPLKAFLVKFREVDASGVEDTAGPTVTSGTMTTVLVPSSALIASTNGCMTSTTPTILTRSAAAAMAASGGSIINGISSTCGAQGTVITTLTDASCLSGTTTLTTDGISLQTSGHHQQLTLASGEEIKINPAAFNAPPGTAIIVPISSQQLSQFAIVQAAAPTVSSVSEPSTVTTQ